MKHCAILTGPYTHLDHLGVLATLLKIPLIVVDENTYELGKKYYPDIPLILKDLSELTLDFLANNIDVLYQSGKFWAEELIPFLKLLYNKEMRIVYCPHGNSDKGHSLTTHVNQDICLVYGEHMLALLEKTGALKKIKQTLITGNYRLPYYLKHKKFYDDLIPKLDPDKKTIFYAPTWSDSENPSSFFSPLETLIDSPFNILIKLHPFLEETHPYHILAKYENCKNVHIIHNFPCIYPLLNYADIYLGDYSSIGYDFLAFDKPLYFLNSNKNSALYSCGLTVPQGANISQFIEKTLQENIYCYSKARKKNYSYAFYSYSDIITSLK